MGRGQNTANILYGDVAHQKSPSRQLSLGDLIERTMRLTDGKIVPDYKGYASTDDWVLRADYLPSSVLTDYEARPANKNETDLIDYMITATPTRTDIVVPALQPSDRWDQNEPLLEVDASPEFRDGLFVSAHSVQLVEHLCGDGYWAVDAVNDMELFYYLNEGEQQLPVASIYIQLEAADN